MRRVKYHHKYQNHKKNPGNRQIFRTRIQVTSSRQRVHIMKFVTLDRRFVFYVGAGWVGGSVVQIVSLRIKCFFIINDSVA